MRYQVWWVLEEVWYWKRKGKDAQQRWPQLGTGPTAGTITLEIQLSSQGMHSPWKNTHYGGNLGVRLLLYVRQEYIQKLSTMKNLPVWEDSRYYSWFHFQWAGFVKTPDLCLHTDEYSSAPGRMRRHNCGQSLGKKSKKDKQTKKVLEVSVQDVCVWEGSCDNMCFSENLTWYMGRTDYMLGMLPWCNGWTLEQENTWVEISAGRNYKLGKLFNFVSTWSHL